MDIKNEVMYIKNSISNLQNTAITNTIEEASPIKQNDSGNTYALNQYQFNQSRLDYQRNLHKKKQDITTYENNQEFFDMLMKNDYSKPWSRLSLYQKKTKLTEYVQSLTTINMQQRKEKLSEYLKKINDKQFQKNIQYDQSTQVIKNIL